MSRGGFNTSSKRKRVHFPSTRKCTRLRFELIFRPEMRAAQLQQTLQQQPHLAQLNLAMSRILQLGQQLD
ncbi:MAG: hypothetical protein JWN70_5730 [Planctomycetaceae bacterium]|nr:hypothetical protein [Planctomycetaceae bacterium]